MAKPPAAKDPTRSVWLQLGFPDAEEHYLKAELVLRLDRAIKSMGLTQRVAAHRIGTTQPELSKILGGKFTEVSLDRLMRFMTALGYDIEIKIGAGKANKAGDVTIKDTRRTARRTEPASCTPVEPHQSSLPEVFHPLRNIACVRYDQELHKVRLST